MDTHGQDYVKAKDMFERVRVSRRYMQYLIRPGDVLLEGSGADKQAFLATSWLTDHTRGKGEVLGHISTGDDSYAARARRVREKSSIAPSSEVHYFSYDWTVQAWHWAFNGFSRYKYVVNHLQLQVTFENDEVDITRLDIYSLMYASSRIRQELEDRGRMFWKCRFKHIVAYTSGPTEGLDDARHIIDATTYNKLHPHDNVDGSNYLADISASRLAEDSPPGGDDLLLFPTMLNGYHLHAKRWYKLFVDQMRDVNWNKQAFKDLIMADATKELILALVENLLEARKSTDVISGKGSGLIVLLHGGPGTGKTFTAESVAEIAQKSLYRITCGEIGTEPSKVEKHLTAVLHLGKIWDCVVLLDEADVFLAERDLRDLNRNALVSIFLHVLEYYDGILILTSNRGAFDEAFESRIQLVLHYKDLNHAERCKVWRDFIRRLNDLDEPIDAEDLEDHLQVLGNEELNGRQIRNAVTSACQLAKFKKQKLSYTHLKHVIDVSGEYEQYTRRLQSGESDVERIEVSGLRAP